eukprot:6078898-Amphidinium_carterae.1
MAVRQERKETNQGLGAFFCSQRWFRGWRSHPSTAKHGHLSLDKRAAAFVRETQLHLAKIPSKRARDLRYHTRRRKEKPFKN